MSGSAALGGFRPEPFRTPNVSGELDPEKTRSLQVAGRRSDGTKGKPSVSAAPSMNSWERGVFRDERGNPVRRIDGSLVTAKEYAENRRHYDEQIRQLRTGVEPAHTKSPKEQRAEKLAAAPEGL